MGYLERSAPFSAEGELVVFDRAHLQQYTMDNPQLEREVVDLFLGQLPDILEHLSASGDGKDWRLWAHTLKGSAVAVGASRIWAVAVELEKPEFHLPSETRATLLSRLAVLADEFAAVAKDIYPSHA